MNLVIPGHGITVFSNFFHGLRLTNVLGSPPWTYERILNWARRPKGEFRLRYEHQGNDSASLHENNLQSTPKPISQGLRMASAADCINITQQQHNDVCPSSLLVYHVQPISALLLHYLGSHNNQRFSSKTQQYPPEPCKTVPICLQPKCVVSRCRTNLP
jgi:hypothetical protein